MGRYLTLDKAKLNLAAYGLDAGIPDARLSLLIESLENRVDAWLDCCVSPKLYIRKIRSDRQGLLMLNDTPVLEIIQLECLLSYFTSNPGTPIATAGLWDGGNYLRTGMSNAYFRVTYRAGYALIPEVFETTIFEALAIALQPENLATGLEFLSRPTADITSLTLPGGVSQTFQVSKTEGASATNEGRLFQRLIPFRRKFRMV